MRCPACRAEVVDPEAAFCSRCASPLRAADAGADGADAPATDPGERVASGARRAPRRATRRAGRLAGLSVPVRDLWPALRRSVATGGWLDAARAASVAFLATLCVGALLVVAGKLASPSIGVGASPISVFVACAMLALAALGAPMRIGDVWVSALPLGALALIGVAIAWCAAKVVRERAEEGPARAEGGRARALEGAKVGLPFALLAWGAALIFRFRTEPTTAAVGAGQALLLGGLWGCLFGAVGGWRAGGKLWSLAAGPLGAVKRRSEAVYLGLQTGAAMLIVVAAASLAGVLLWIIVALARGAAPPSFGIGDALAGLLFLAAFLPNVCVSLVSLALGAPVEVGAKVRVSGRELGPVESFSLSDWGGHSAPWYVWVLVLIPALACVLAGFAARRNARGKPSLFEVLPAAALAFALPLGVVAALADARLGAGLVRPRGFAHVAPSAPTVFVAALLWAVALGFLGWRMAESQKEDRFAPLPGEPEGNT